MTWDIGEEEPESTQIDDMCEGSRGRRTTNPGVEMYGKINRVGAERRQHNTQGNTEEEAKLLYPRVGDHM